MATTLIQRLFARGRPPQGEQPTDYDAIRDGGADGLEAEYQKLISLQLKRWGVGESCASVEVRHVGEAADGRDVFVGVVRLFAWERKPALRLLLGLPLLESKVRRTLAGLWLAEVSHFGGLWLHASGQLQESAATADLRHLMVTLTGTRAQAAARGEAKGRPG